jgi:hypothetical protein
VLRRMARGVKESVFTHGSALQVLCALQQVKAAHGSGSRAAVCDVWFTSIHRSSPPSTNEGRGYHRNEQAIED